MSIPKCTSWFGHKYEGRYSTKDGLPTNLDLEGTNADGVAKIIAARKDKTYIHDICIRCGHVVHVSSPNGVAL